MSWINKKISAFWYSKFSYASRIAEGSFSLNLRLRSCCDKKCIWSGLTSLTNFRFSPVLKYLDVPMIAVITFVWLNTGVGLFMSFQIRVRFEGCRAGEVGADERWVTLMGSFINIEMDHRWTLIKLKHGQILLKNSYIIMLHSIWGLKTLDVTMLINKLSIPYPCEFLNGLSAENCFYNGKDTSKKDLNLYLIYKNN